MLRVTLNSSCVQFASEIERTDVFLVKIINNMCSVILFSRLFAIFISHVWKKKTILSQQNVPPSLLSLSQDMVNFLRAPIFLVARKSLMNSL